MDSSAMVIVAVDS